MHPKGLGSLLSIILLCIFVILPAWMFGSDMSYVPMILGSLALSGSLLFSLNSWHFLVLALLSSVAVYLPEALTLRLDTPAIPLGFILSLLHCSGLELGFPGCRWSSLLLPLVSASSFIFPPSLFLATAVCSMMMSMLLTFADPFIGNILSRVESSRILIILAGMRALQMSAWATNQGSPSSSYPILLSFLACVVLFFVEGRLPALGPTLKFNPLSLALLEVSSAAEPLSLAKQVCIFFASQLSNTVPIYPIDSLPSLLFCPACSPFFRCLRGHRDIQVRRNYK